MEKHYGYISPWEFERAPEHLNMFNYKTIEDFEATIESYHKYDRFKPVYYVERTIEGKNVKHTIDGEKYIQFARDNKKEQVFACKLIIDNDDDLITVMAQLQRSNHDNFMALFGMIQALWSKHFRGQGYRSDIKEEELDIPTVSADGKRLNIYERIGRDLFITGNKVKHIRKIGMVNDLHFERIEKGRFTLYQAYQECVKEERGEMPDVPSIKAPVYHTTSTGVPVFTEPTTTADDDVIGETPKIKNPANDTGEQPSTTPPSEVSFVTVASTCPHCGEEIKLRINKNELQ